MLKTEQRMHYALRIAVAMCFIGHGSFGIITKPIWCNYFGVFGIGTDAAYSLMPWVGVMDVTMGIIMLFYPIRAIALWLVAWGALTAFLRPASGEPFAEFIERAGNFGAPLALLILSGGVKGFKHLFVPIDPSAEVSENALKNTTICLKLVAFLLLMGHGWLNLLEKKGLLNQYASLGFSSPGKVSQFVGVFEIVAACIVLIKPIRGILMLFIVWKIVSELFYPNYEVFEWIERGGSYGTLIALWFALKQVPSGFALRSFNKHNLT
jgi:hypothetical protein